MSAPGVLPSEHPSPPLPAAALDAGRRVNRWTGLPMVSQEEADVMTAELQALLDDWHAAHATPRKFR